MKIILKDDLPKEYDLNVNSNTLYVPIMGTDEEGNTRVRRLVYEDTLDEDDSGNRIFYLRGVI